MGPTGLIHTGGALQSYAAWVNSTWLHYFAVNYKWVWATMETLHFLGLGLMVGTIGVLDLRLLGFAKGLPIASVQKLVPWGVGAFVLNTLTGIVFLAGAPYQYLYNFAFQMKVIFMVAAGVNVFIFYTGTWQRAQTIAAGQAAPWPARIAGAVSLFLWIGVMYWGRMLTFFRPPFVAPPK
jgi:hypothetical protein